MREITTITLNGIENGNRARAVEIISKALVKDFSKSTMIFQKGYYTEGSIESVPPHTSVFIIGWDESTHEKENNPPNQDFCHEK
jgi:hypothetical protein